MKESISENKSSETNREKIISLSEWANRKNHLDEEKGQANYFNVLNFHELINESKELINEIETKKHYCQKMAIRARLLINEFSARVGMESRELSELMTKMAKEIDERMMKLRQKDQLENKGKKN